MSARKRRLTITPAARQDLQDVLAYTERRWGNDQRRAYRTRLQNGMRSLTDFPERGAARDDLFTGCRILTIEQHIALYHVTDRAIVVGRILHVRQNPSDHIDP